MNDRYSRQEVFYGVGKEGQKKLLKSKVAIIGAGALGTVTANLLVRAGVGFVRIVDRDYVELSNLQRQVIYDEEDARNAVPKAEAACRHLRQVNSEIDIEPVINDFNSSTADSIIRDVDLVMDATDSLSTRFLINEACRHHKKTWIYGGAVGSAGMTANYIYGDDEPCMCCLMRPEMDDGNGATCTSAGVLGSATNIVASIQCSEAIKYLTGNSEAMRRTMLSFDLWKNLFEEFPLFKDPNCPVCAKGEYTFYGKAGGMQAISLCGRNSVQIVPVHVREIDFPEFAARLEKVGKVSFNSFTLDFDNGDFQIKLFKNGRALIKNVDDVNRAKSIYSEYIGL